MSEDLRPSVEEAVGSLTGFDEIAIARSFHNDFQSLTPTMTARALYFTLQRRAGRNDADAYNDAMTATILHVNDSFSDSEESGKGESGSVSETPPTPTS